MDEYIFGTNPTNAATFGTNDHRFSRVTNTVDSVPIRFIVGDTGKHNNGMNCAVCHTTGLQVGGTRLLSFDRYLNADRVVNLEKGKSYPVRLLDLLGILPPVTGNTATPTNTARYTAQILPADANAPTFLVTDPQAILGTDKLWTARVFTWTNAIGLCFRAESGQEACQRARLTWFGHNPAEFRFESETIQHSPEQHQLLTVIFG